MFPTISLDGPLFHSFIHSFIHLTTLLFLFEVQRPAQAYRVK